jgi:hypothetical protein
MVATFAGTGPVSGSCGTVGTDSNFAPQYLGVDNSSNVYVTDANVDKITPTGVSVIVGISGNAPNGFFVDGAGVCYYSEQTSFAEDTEILNASSSNSILFQKAPSCTDTSASDGGAGAGIGSAAGIAADSNGNFYVADAACYKVREIATDGTISTIAGTGVQGVKNGAGNVAQFSQLAGIMIDATGNLYVYESDVGDIREVQLDGTTSSITSSATALGGMAIAADGTIYFSDDEANEIKLIDPTSHVVSVIAGTGVAGFMNGAGPIAEFNSPAGVGVDGNTGDVYVADTSNCLVRVLTPPPASP